LAVEAKNIAGETLRRDGRAGFDDCDGRKNRYDAALNPETTKAERAMKAPPPFLVSGF
jgi:hypothetical protein